MAFPMLFLSSGHLIQVDQFPIIRCSANHEQYFLAIQMAVPTIRTTSVGGELELPWCLDGGPKDPPRFICAATG
jgi:hypothetical protein